MSRENPATKTRKGKSAPKTRNGLHYLWIQLQCAVCPTRVLTKRKRIDPIKNCRQQSFDQSSTQSSATSWRADAKTCLRVLPAPRNQGGLTTVLTDITCIPWPVYLAWWIGILKPLKAHSWKWTCSIESEKGKSANSLHDDFRSEMEKNAWILRWKRPISKHLGICYFLQNHKSSHILPKICKDPYILPHRRAKRTDIRGLERKRSGLKKILMILYEKSPKMKRLLSVLRDEHHIGRRFLHNRQFQKQCWKFNLSKSRWIQNQRKIKRKSKRVNQ